MAGIWSGLCLFICHLMALLILMLIRAPEVIVFGCQVGLLWKQSSVSLVCVCVLCEHESCKFPHIRFVFGLSELEFCRT